MDWNFIAQSNIAIPLIAGPGAIVTAVTISTSNPEYGMIGALSGVVAVVLFPALVPLFLSFTLLVQLSRAAGTYSEWPAERWQQLF